MNPIKQDDQVTLTGKVINTYANGTVRVQLSPSGACYDVNGRDLTPPLLSVTTSSVPK